MTKTVSPTHTIDNPSNSLACLWKRKHFCCFRSLNQRVLQQRTSPFLNYTKLNVLPQNVKHKEQRTSLDLHGMNQAFAHSAARIALQQLAILGELRNFLLVAAMLKKLSPLVVAFEQLWNKKRRGWNDQVCMWFERWIPRYNVPTKTSKVDKEKKIRISTNVLHYLNIK
jgi:hypothetical protein